MSSLMSGYIDRSGTFVIPPDLRTAKPFSSSLAMAKPYGSWNYSMIDRTGRRLVNDIVNFSDFDDGVGVFNVGGRFEGGACVGGHKVQRFLHEHKGSITGADGLEVDKQQRSGAIKGRFAATRNCYHTRARSIDHG